MVKYLACFLWIALAWAGVTNAQSNVVNPPTTQAGDDSIIYTLTINDEMLEALRGGKSLMSVIPESIRGKVDKIKIEYAPSAQSDPRMQSGGGSSILKQNSSTIPAKQLDDSRFASPTSFQTEPPPIRSGTGLQRSDGYGQESAAPSSSGSIFGTRSNTSSLPLRNPPSLLPNRTSNDSTNPDRWTSGSRTNTEALTPVGRNDQYWFSSSNSQRDSGLAYPTDLNGGRQMQIPDFGSPNGGLARAALDDSRRDVPNYSGPPYSQSLPPISSPQLQTSVANAGNWPQRTAAADSFPSTVTSQTVTKQPMDMSVRSTIAADSSATRTDKRTLVYMFMLLLCSIGLNIYLGWISRGFYVRYHELAEELRETFTPSGAN